MRAEKTIRDRLAQIENLMKNESHPDWNAMYNEAKVLEWVLGGKRQED
jgi:ATP/maltotriose-dependent transcriptional regulator MalT